MKRLLRYYFFLLLLPVSLTSQTVVSMTVDGTINPVTADYIHNGIRKAVAEKAQCLIIHLNTPGGLLKSTRVIVTDLLEAQVPVVVYVSPGGAHAGSAGVFLTLAAHIAVMAPATNIGAAHPVGMQGQMDTTMNAKVTNDAAAFIRSIAEKRHRNAEWAEEAVRRSSAFTETEALQDSAIDLVVATEQQLLFKLEGRTVQLNDKTVTLHTANATLVPFEMTVWERLLDLISDPNVAYVFFLLGVYGLLFELYSPGAILPGIIGGIALILAFYSMHTLPINYAGLALIVFAIILFLLEIKVTSYGMLAIGGVVALLLGSMMLIKSTSPMEVVRLSTGVVVTATAVSALFFLVILGYGLKAQRLQVVTGMEGLLGSTAEVTEALNPTGMVRVQGELWSATTTGEAIETGVKVRVTGQQHFTLFVEPISQP